MSERKPAKAKPSSQRALKSLYRKHVVNVGKISLRDFVKQYCLTQAGKVDADLQRKASDWLFNKRANFSSPPLGLGSTRKKKGAQKK